MSPPTPRPTARPTALVALRDPGEGKTRLAPSLSPGERAEVARAMARDVVDALRAAGVTDVTVVAQGARAARFARSLRLPVVRDRRPWAGLNGALGDALATLGPDTDALLVCGDLPGLRPTDVAAVLATDADVTVAPTRDGGTGGLLLRAGARIELAYGRDSAAAHLRHGTESELTTAVVDTPGFHHDVDEPADLRAAAVRWPGSHTAWTVDSWGWRRLASG